MLNARLLHPLVGPPALRLGVDDTIAFGSAIARVDKWDSQAHNARWRYSMGLSPEVVRGLEAELRRLENERRTVDATIASIRQLLGQSSGGSQGQPMGNSAMPKGFREGIRAVLREAGKPLTPKEVAAVIQTRKYPGWDSENLNSRVNNDLWKMKENGQLEKPDGGYILAEEGGEGEQ